MSTLVIEDAVVRWCKIGPQQAAYDFNKTKLEWSMEVGVPEADSGRIAGLTGRNPKVDYDNGIAYFKFKRPTLSAKGNVEPCIVGDAEGNPFDFDEHQIGNGSRIRVKLWLGEPKGQTGMSRTAIWIDAVQVMDLIPFTPDAGKSPEQAAQEFFVHAGGKPASTQSSPSKPVKVAPSPPPEPKPQVEPPTGRDDWDSIPF